MERSLVNYFLPESPEFPFSEGFQCFGKHKLTLTKDIFVSTNAKIILFIVLKGFFDTANLIVQLVLSQNCENVWVLDSNILNFEWHHHILKRPEIIFFLLENLVWGDSSLCCWIAIPNISAHATDRN